MQTERKQVPIVGNPVAGMVSQVAAPTAPIGGTMHGLAKDLTFRGTGFEDKPVNTVLPAISGVAQEDEVLTCSQGTWASQEVITSFAYAWYRSGVAIGGATAATYTVVSDDVDETLTCRVTATSAGGATTAETAATGTVIAAA